MKKTMLAKSVMTLVFGLALTGLAGCGNNGGGGSSNNNTNAVYAAAGIANGTALYSSMMTGTSNRDLVITGTMVGSSGYASQGQQVGISGTLTVNGSEWGLPLGTYSLSTPSTGVGYMNGLTFGGIQMQASGSYGTYNITVQSGSVESASGEMQMVLYISGYYGTVSCITY